MESDAGPPQCAASVCVSSTDARRPASASWLATAAGSLPSTPTGQTYTICDPQNSGTTNLVSRIGGMVIDDDGLLWVPVVANVTNRSVSCTPQVDNDGNAVPWDGSGTSYTYSSTLYLLSVDSGGTVSTIQLDSTGGSGTNWNAAMPKFSVRNAIIPDGVGGVLVSVVRPNGSNPIYRSNGVQYSTPLSSVDQMLMGESETVFAAGVFGGVTAVNLQTGSTLWRPDAVNLTLALGDGTLVAENALSLVRYDTVGSASDFVGETSTYASTFLGGDLWSGGGSVGGLALIASECHPQGDPTMPCWIGPNWAAMSGNQQKQNAPPARVELRVHRVTQAPALVEHILQLADTAVRYWSWQGVRLDWDGVVRPIDQCLINPGNCLDTDDENILNLSTDTVFRWQQSLRVFEKFTDRKGIDAVFINSVLGSNDALITLHFPTTSCCNYSLRKSNVVVASSDADNALDHEIGHVFQLDHTLNPFNLMCDPSVLVCVGRFLNDAQQSTVRVEAPKLAR
ncbi:MAG TPA: hypothetical protein VNK82_02900 [Terriglobales bacterium]|nr:hypothetical protein [Terriglobales bacterium]